jgi:hypothetical protein
LNKAQEVARPLIVRSLRATAHTNGPQMVIQETAELEESKICLGTPPTPFIKFIKTN